MFICSQHCSFPVLGSRWRVLLFSLLLGRSEVTFAYPPGSRSKEQAALSQGACLHVQLSPMSLRCSGHLSPESSFAVGLASLCLASARQLPCCFGTSGLEGQAGKVGDPPVLCGRMMCLGKLGTEQSLAWEQLFPLKSEDAGNKSSPHHLREQPWPRSGVLAGSV